jgi:hypothetical protein
MARRKLKFWILSPVVVVIGLIAVVVIVGFALPKEHVASRTLKISQTPDTIWNVICDFQNQPSWLPLVTSVEKAQDHNGKPVWLEIYKDSGDKVTLETTESIAPQKLVRTIPDTGGPFFGRWEYEITPTQGGCTVKITEYGVVTNPVFRFMSRFVFGHYTTVESYLKALAARFGQPADIF